MADASASLHSIHPKSEALQSRTTEETSVATTSSGHSTPTGSHKRTKGEINMSSSAQSDYDKTQCSKETAYVESVDISDEDYDDTSISDNALHSHSYASAQDPDDWKDHPTTPKVPWRKGGVWHLRSGNRRDGHRRTSSVGSGKTRRNPMPLSGNSVYDSDSGLYLREVQPHPPYDDFEDTDSESEMISWGDFLNIDPDLHTFRDLDTPNLPEEPLYPQGPVHITECYVCFEESELRRRLCCDFPVCDRCLESYLMVQVLQANVNIECLNISCNSYIHRNEISARLPPKFKLKFYKFLIDANVDPTVKTCPRCSSGLQVDKSTLKKRKVIKNGLHVTCKKCHLDWCFTCHAPLHKGLTCKEFRKGDILLKEWAREFHYGQLNAQQCPKCKCQRVKPKRRKPDA